MHENAQADWGEPKWDTALSHIDGQIEFLEKNLAVARDRLAPVLCRYDTKEMAEPRPAEPSSDLRARAERLRELNARFESLINQLDI